MSGISLKEFYEKAAQDPALDEKLKALSRELAEELRALAAGAGYELEETVPLSDEEAADAAGGEKWLRHPRLGYLPAHEVVDPYA